MNIRYPNITGKSPAEQITQLRAYLYQLVEQLNMQSDSGAGVVIQKTGTAAAQGGAADGAAGQQSPTPQSSFNQIKSLIIKSADIVNAYYEEINKRLVGEYVAQSDFGTYQSQVSQDIKETADGIERAFSSIQKIEGELNQRIETSANIRTGRLFTVGEENLEPELGQNLPDGVEVYGVEVGQTNVVDGAEVFKKFARFTAYGMTLYDNNGTLSAYITDNRLNIPNAAIKNSMTRGGFVETIYADGSSAERWVGV